jgi:hypothetical protein
MGWLVFGAFLGSLFAISIAPAIGTGQYERTQTYVYEKMLVMFLSLLTSSPFAIGGFVVVGQMLNSYGNCIKIT